MLTRVGFPSYLEALVVRRRFALVSAVYVAAFDRDRPTKFRLGAERKNRFNPDRGELAGA